ncbi:glutathione peroxidase [Pseudogemmobacter sp. W21_MBD1_M6]|uniref:glutathione peroxidase n=1 Tax=Pseudogemmobacter sp. W21_MBD1_M6 TaxID=3240271 RepID=UPI003F9E22C5
MRRASIFAVLSVAALPALAAAPFSFASIDGGELSLDAWKGHPVLIANTASQCGFTPQYDDLQVLYDTYKDRGLVVLAVPSDDFNQELATEADVKDFCAVNFGLTLPMTEITHVKGREAHPFYVWVKEQTGFVPAWNFNKILIDADGAVVATFGSVVKPTSAKITGPIEAMLTQ